MKKLEDFRKLHDPVYERHDVGTPLNRELRKDAKVFVITGAQNATPVDKEWLSVLKTVVKDRNAELLVVPLRYKNPTSLWSGSARNAESWAEEVREYLWNTRLEINENLMLLADVKTQPTASSPLSDFEGVSHASSCIIAHPKLQMKSVATPSSKMAKILTTTGVCTVSNYTDSRAGKVGDFHHSLSAVIVEVEGKKFYLRHLHYDKKTKSCTDLNAKYLSTGKVVPAPRALAVVMGDTHVDFVDPGVYKATFGEGGLLETVEPEFLVYHDLLDGYAVNPHHDKNAFNKVAKAKSGSNNVWEEVSRAIQFVADNTPDGCTGVVVPSNHDDFLRRWIVNTDWREDPVNAEFYLETALEMVRATEMTPSGTSYPSPFAMWLKKANLDGVRVLGGDESLMLAGVELGMHGDIGPNGARGSIKNLRRIGTKSIIGHSHSVGIDEGCYQVGTSTLLRLEYNHGPSGWLNAHCVLNADGKRQIIIIVDGEFRSTQE